MSQLWTTQRAGTSGHQWSEASNVSTSPWYDNGAQSALARYPGSSGNANNDYVRINHNVTLDISLTIGTSENTGVTPAIVVNYGTSGTVVFTIDSAVVLTLTGDLKTQGVGSYATLSTTSMSAGSQIVFVPPASQQYRLAFSQSGQLQANGSPGSRCVIKTDATAIAGGGLRAICTQTNVAPCVTLATYTDFIDLGTTSAPGVWSTPQSTTYTAANVDITIDHCTFTRATYQLSQPNGGTRNKAITFTNNIFNSTFTGWAAGSGTALNFCANFDSTTETTTITGCGFDRAVFLQHAVGVTMHDNVFGDMLLKEASGTATSWTSDTQCYNNAFIGRSSNSYTFSLFGPAKNCYLYKVDDTGSHNPHYASTGPNTTSITGLIFESNSGYVGDCLMTGGAITCDISLCLSIPGGDGYSSGTIVSCLSMTSGAHTVRHNTQCCWGEDVAFVMLGEGSGTSFAGMIAECRSNLIWAPAGAGPSPDRRLIIWDFDGIADAVTLSDYNAIFNPSTGTCYYNTSTSQSGVAGYSNVKVSANTPLKSAGSQIGEHDLSITDPLFVDATRNIANWWLTTQGGSDQGTYALNTDAGVAALVANPALVGQATTGLLAWVRAGFVPQNSVLHNASYPADTGWTDANGTAVTGVADIGAMAVLGSVSLNESALTSAGTPGGEGCAINIYLGRTN